MSDELSTPATKADLFETRDQLRSEMKEMRAELRLELDQLRSEMQHGYDDLKETMRDNQTELLKAFYSYATTNDVKMKDSEASDSALRQRLTAVEVRLLDVEKRLNMPPAA